MRSLIITNGLLLYTHDLRNSMKEQTQFCMEIYLSHFILERVDVNVVWEMGGDRDWLLYWPNFFSWTYHAVLSSRTHLALLPHHLAGVAQPGIAEDHIPQSANSFSLWPSCVQLTQLPLEPAYILS